MESWDCNKKEYVETPKEVVGFLNEIVEVCEKHGFSIGHEDKHGCFKLEKYSESNIRWLKQTTLNLK